MPSQLKTRKFCGQECVGLSRKGQRKNGYVFVMVAILSGAKQTIAKKMTPKGKYIAEHRIVAAVSLGRPLARDETVHHKNGDKADNNPSNLIVMERSGHSISHRAIEIELHQLRLENRALKLKIAKYRKAGGPTS
jgi:hypothetical protein